MYTDASHQNMLEFYCSCFINVQIKTVLHYLKIVLVNIQT